MQRHYWGILLCMLLALMAQAQTVWPGDVNNNGVVNGVDLLYWGVAFGAEGPARNDQTTDWVPLAAPALWSQNFPNGINYGYADCDGNGAVEEGDFSEAIEENFGRVQGTLTGDGYANAGPGTAPKLKLTPSSTLVEEGAMVNISLQLEDAPGTIGQFYGMALQLSYTTGLLEGGDGPDFDFTEDNWIEGDESYVEDLFEDDDGSGSAELAITRTNQLSIPAQDNIIGTFSIIVEDIIVGLTVDTFILTIDSILLINEHLDHVAITPDTAIILIAKDTTTISTVTGVANQPNSSADKFYCYPNPTRGELIVESDAPIQRISIFDQMGQRVFQLNLASGSTINPPRIILPDLPSGPYWLVAHTQSGIFQRRLIHHSFW